MLTQEDLNLIRIIIRQELDYVFGYNRTKGMYKKDLQGSHSDVIPLNEDEMKRMNQGY